MICHQDFASAASSLKIGRWSKTVSSVQKQWCQGMTDK